MSSSAISKRYARALVDLGAEQKMVEQYGEELAKVSSAFAAQSALRLILESPTFPQEKKTAILSDLIETIVITSYSIHYTKLYEGPAVRASRAQADRRRYAARMKQVV